MELLREQFRARAADEAAVRAVPAAGSARHAGTNLNRTDVRDALPIWEDPRLAPLKGLLNREKEN